MMWSIPPSTTLDNKTLNADFFDSLDVPAPAPRPSADATQRAARRP
jgi:hypothetical protein